MNRTNLIPNRMSDFDPYRKWLGIKPEEQPPNHYRLLGISLYEDDPDVIDSAVEQRVTFLQTCASGPNLKHSQKILNEVADARNVLLDAEKKEAYDAELHATQAGPKNLSATSATSADDAAQAKASADSGSKPVVSVAAQLKKRHKRSTGMIVAIAFAITATGGFFWWLVSGDGTEVLEDVGKPTTGEHDSTAGTGGETQTGTSGEGTAQSGTGTGSDTKDPKGTGETGSSTAQTGTSGTTETGTSGTGQTGTSGTDSTGTGATTAQTGPTGRDAAELTAKKPGIVHTFPDSHKSDVVAVAISNNLNVMASAEANGFVVTRSLADEGKILDRFEVDGKILGLTFNSSSDRYAVLTPETIYVRDFANQKIAWREKPLPAPEFTCITHRPFTEFYLTGRLDGTAVLRGRGESGNPGSGHRLVGHDAPVTCVAMSASGRLAVTASEDETLRLWHVDSKEEVGKYPVEAVITKVAISPDERRIIGLSKQGLHSWDLFTQQPFPVVPVSDADQSGLALIGEDPFAVITGSDGGLEIVNLETLRKSSTISSRGNPALRLLAVSPDGVAAVTDATFSDSDGSPDRTVAVWRLPDVNPRSTESTAGGLIGRATGNGSDTGVIFRYPHARFFNRGHIPSQVLDHKRFRITLEGFLDLPRDMTVNVWLAGGGVSNDVNWLYIDEKEIGSTGDDRGRSYKYKLPLSKGRHQIKWLLTGGAFRTNILVFLDPETGELLPLKNEGVSSIRRSKDEPLVEITGTKSGWPVPENWLPPVVNEIAGGRTKGDSPAAHDVLPHLNLTRDIVNGDWTYDGNLLRSGTGSSSEIHLPASVPLEYTLHVKVRRSKGMGLLRIHLPFHDAIAKLVINGDRGRFSGLEFIDGKGLIEAQVGHRRDWIVSWKKEHTVVATVTESGITAKVDGQTLFEWEGTPDQLRLHYGRNPAWPFVREINLHTGSAQYEFSSIQLLPPDGEAQTIFTSPLIAKAKPIVDQIEIPAEADLTAESDRLKTSLAELYADTKNRPTLIAQLIKLAGESQDEPATQYVAWSEAATLAGEAGDATQAFLTLDQITARYEGTHFELKDAVFSSLSKKRDKATTAQLVLFGFNWVEDLMDADEYDQASTILSRARGAAVRLKDARLRELADYLNTRIRTVSRAFEPVKTHVAKLAEEPDDAAAAEMVGMFRCFVQEDWERGLPLLAKSADATLKQLAAQDQAAPTSPVEQTALADAWWAYSTSRPAADRDAIRRRAGHWYVTAILKLPANRQAEFRAKEQRVTSVPATVTIAAKADSGDRLIIRRDGAIWESSRGKTSVIYINRFPWDVMSDNVLPNRGASRFLPAGVHFARAIMQKVQGRDDVRMTITADEIVIRFDDDYSGAGIYQLLLTFGS